MEIGLRKWFGDCVLIAIHCISRAVRLIYQINLSTSNSVSSFFLQIRAYDKEAVESSSYDNSLDLKLGISTPSSKEIGNLGGFQFHIQNANMLKVTHSTFCLFCSSIWKTQPCYISVSLVLILFLAGKGQPGTHRVGFDLRGSEVGVANAWSGSCNTNYCSSIIRILITCRLQFCFVPQSLLLVQSHRHLSDQILVSTPLVWGIVLLLFFSRENWFVDG